MSEQIIEQEQAEQIHQNLAQDQAEAFNPEQTPEQQQPEQPEQQNDSIQPIPHIQTRKTPEELEQQKEIDSRSIYIGNVDYKSTPDEIETFFAKVGSVIRVTILQDKYTGYPKGYAYVEFENSDDSTKAIEELNGSTFKDRVISVVAKRTNLPGFRSQRGGYRGGSRGGRGRGPFRGGNRGRGGYRGRGGFRQQTNESAPASTSTAPTAPTSSAPVEQSE